MSSTITKSTNKSNLSKSSAGLYSTSGFDLLTILSAIHNRPNPQIQLGPVDLSCAFVVSDANQPDCPIVYVSDAFEDLTGYALTDCIGHNCRFLQQLNTDPKPILKGDVRRRTDNNIIFKMKQCVDGFAEGQFNLINYKKNGEPFINLVSMIPVKIDKMHFIVGFQVNLIEQPTLIMNKMASGSYIINYQLDDTQYHSDASSKLSKQSKPSKMSKNDKSSAKQSNTPKSPINYLPEMIDDLQDPLLLTKLGDHAFYELLHSQIPILIISKNGQILHTSPSANDLLEYNASDLLNKPLHQFTCQSDWNQMRNELKNQSDLQFAIRFNRKSNGYFWCALNGQLITISNKSCFIFTLLPHPVSVLSNLHYFNGLSNLWCKTSLNGLLLVVSPNYLVQQYFGLNSKEMLSKNILDYVHDLDYSLIQEGLEEASRGKIVKCHHQMRHVLGHYTTVETIFFPGSFEYYPKNNKTLAEINMANMQQLNQEQGVVQSGVGHLGHMTSLFVKINKLSDSALKMPSNLEIYEYYPESDNVFKMFDPNETSKTWQYDLNREMKVKEMHQ
eukprot:NODE_754_length_4199_cov_1.046829.p1 type:complete len:558 gc:universal NODE_754_length_4199_cov_1.046829:3822-2149(-)